MDLGCGTGDLAILAAKKSGAGVSITGVDFVAEMLESGRSKAARSGVAGRIDFVLGDAGALPFPDSSFDAVGLAFSFRNLAHRNPGREKHLREIHRVLKPGGKLAIVETSQPGNPVMKWGFHWYMRRLVAPLGGLVSDPAAYRYLAESAVGFMDRREARGLLEEASFSAVTSRPLLGGVAALLVGRKERG
jgi:demethylmenaquinone methyltransferase/2-methoxy-6-polyprenyl-1,4-benzoquinol methylase